MQLLFNFIFLLFVPFAHIHVEGELVQRLQQNFNRLEESKYQPQNVFLTMQQSGDWPGDTEGRTILALTLDAKATGRAPRYLDEIIGLLPNHMNEKGYMGPVFPHFAHEQQLSGNGWMLRGLCEYYLWKPSPTVLSHIRHISRNLFLPHKGRYARYPISPDERRQDTGAESGSTVGQLDGWQLSSDIGCVFIGMDGLIQAYGILHDEELRPVIDEMVGRFLQIDLVGIKAQTHATLTALRGLLRLADLTGRQALAREAEQRFLLYVRNGMTENFENYNWFNRFDTWTEPCAIVDSYMLAMQLWQHTRKEQYLQWAEKIYYNALCRTQRRNGGFGLDNCPGRAAGTAELRVHAPEAHWCCTMRGGEGLARAAQYTVRQEGRRVWISTLRPLRAQLPLEGRATLGLRIATAYPMDTTCSIVITQADGGRTIDLHLPCHPWMERPTVMLNGREIKVKRRQGFLRIRHAFQADDSLAYRFSQRLYWDGTQNATNTLPRQRRAFYGPLMLQLDGTTVTSPLPHGARLEKTGSQAFGIIGTSLRLTPVYHMMSPHLWQKQQQGHPILFDTEE